MSDIKNLVRSILLECLTMLMLGAVAMVPVWFFWNQVIPHVFNLARITVWDAFCLYQLYSIITYYAMKGNSVWTKNEESVEKSEEAAVEGQEMKSDCTHVNPREGHSTNK